MTKSLVTKLPLYADESYVYSAIFGTTEVVLEFNYNSRSLGWYLDISDGALNPLVKGLKLLPAVIHGADFSLEAYGIKGYLILLPVTPDLKWQDIEPTGIYQYYNLFYVEEV